MKVIITGATGFVGGEVLRQAIHHPSITTALVLTRRAIPPTLLALDTHKKIKQIIHQDFGSYPPSLLDQLRGAEACIWVVGGKAGDFPDMQTARKVNVEYTMAFAEAVAQHVVPGLEAGKTFRFVLCSGLWAERDPAKWSGLWLLPATRRLKGEIENGLFALSEQNRSRFQAFTVRPAGIMPREGGLLLWAMWAMSFVLPCVSVDELVAVMIDFALGGSVDGVVALDNNDVAKKGKKLLRRK